MSCMLAIWGSVLVKNSGVSSWPSSQLWGSWEDGEGAIGELTWDILLDQIHNVHKIAYVEYDVTEQTL